MNRISSALAKVPHKVFDIVRSIILRANYYKGNYQSVVWLIGDGRSGTTFVSDLINYDKRYREMFEPFHPTFVKPMRGLLRFHQYIRPNTQTSPFSKLGSDIFTGKFTDSFVDSANTRLLYKDLLIKDIFANLLACWAVNQYSAIAIKPVLLIRNPYAVALSKFKTKHWTWMTDPREFLEQQDLVEDYLYPFTDVINSVGDDYIERQLMIWSIIHFIPLRQFTPEKIHILFYENLVSNPEDELRSLLRYIDPAVSEDNVHDILPRLSIPSRVSVNKSSIMTGDSPIDSWNKEIKEQQLQNGARILKTFGLDHIYAGGSMPQVKAKNLFLS